MAGKRFEVWEGIYEPTAEERAAGEYGAGWRKFFDEAVRQGWAIGELRLLKNRKTKFRFQRAVEARP